MSPREETFWRVAFVLVVIVGVLLGGASSEWTLVPR